LWKKLKDKQSPRDISPKGVPFHRYPNSYYQADRQAGHTWHKIGKLICELLPNEERTVTILNHKSSFSNACYLIEVNSVPSKQHHSHKKMTRDEREKRFEFLKKILISQAKPRYVIVHGADTVKSLLKDNGKSLRVLGFSKKPEKIETTPYTHALYPSVAKEGKQVLLLTKQLSGASGISNKSYRIWAKRMQQIMK
jgi:hypothetical protein